MLQMRVQVCLAFVLLQVSTDLELTVICEVTCLHVLLLAATYCCEAAAHSEAGCSLDCG